jgi:hypothetical protein
MTLLHLLPPLLSLLVLAAHVLRAGSVVIMVILLGVAALLLVRRRWVVRVVQVVLLLGAFDWLMTLVDLARWRLLAGQPMLRMTLILGAVAVFTALSPLAFRSDRLRRRYGFLAPGSSRPSTEG